jgi:predicted metal-dependent hydrolase
MALHEETRIFAGRRLRFCIRRSARARRLSATVGRRRGLIVVLPRKGSRADVERFFTDAAAWLVHQLDLHDVWDGPVRRSYATGSTLTILGQPHRLVFTVLDRGRVRVQSRRGAGVLHLSLPAAELLDPRATLMRWLRRFAAEYLRRRTEQLAENLGWGPTRVIVGDRTTRWGSCSRTGTVSYCYRLVMAPPAVVDAVIVHELCHLRVLDHGPRFHRLVTASCPDHDDRMAWLRAHGEELEI